MNLADIQERVIEYYEIWTLRPGADERWYIHDFGYYSEEFAQKSLAAGKKKFPANKWALAWATLSRTFVSGTVTA